MAAVVGSAALCGPAAMATTSTAAATGGVRMTVVSVTPSTPQRSFAPRPLSVVLRLDNVNATAVNGITINGERGDPLETQKALDVSLKSPARPATGLKITPKSPVQVDLAPHSNATVTFATDTDIPQDAGICLCHQAIYPLVFSAVHDADGTLLASAVTWVPIFSVKPEPVRVSWVWPLIDRPHRLLANSVFTDDELATLVSTGGRLDDSLTVVEQVGARNLPITVVIDPELLDELAAMAGGYLVQAPGKRPVAGTGESAATAWLARLRTLLSNHRNVQVELTPYADPDVESLSAHGLTWTPLMPSAADSQMESQVQTALGNRRLTAAVAWPAGGAVHQNTLEQLVDNGVRTVLLDDTAVRQPSGPTRPALARLSADGKLVATALLSNAVQRYAAAALTNPGGTGRAQLQKLVSEIAIVAAQEPDAEHVQVITPPRYVDPDPASAVQTILETSATPFSSPIALADATSRERLPSSRARLSAASADDPGLPAPVIASARAASAAIPAVDSLLGADTQAAPAVLASLPLGLQRCGSAAWRVYRSIGTAFGLQLTAQLATLTRGVHIVSPSSGSYTLGSNDSPLPITIQNDLPFVVRVRVAVTTVNFLPGFAAADIGPQNIQPGAKKTVRLPTRIARSGRIRIQAQLLTPDNQPLGKAVKLSVHATVLGTIGVVITVVSGAVLAVALLVRAVRRIRARRHRPTPVPRVPASTGPFR